MFSPFDDYLDLKTVTSKVVSEDDINSSGSDSSDSSDSDSSEIEVPDDDDELYTLDEVDELQNPKVRTNLKYINLIDYLNKNNISHIPFYEYKNYEYEVINKEYSQKYNEFDEPILRSAFYTNVTKGSIKEVLLKNKDNQVILDKDGQPKKVLMNLERHNKLLQPIKWHMLTNPENGKMINQRGLICYFNNSTEITSKYLVQACSQIHRLDIDNLELFNKYCPKELINILNKAPFYQSRNKRLYHFFVVIINLPKGKGVYSQTFDCCTNTKCRICTNLGKRSVNSSCKLDTIKKELFTCNKIQFSIGKEGVFDLLFDMAFSKYDDKVYNHDNGIPIIDFNMFGDLLTELEYSGKPITKIIKPKLEKDKAIVNNVEVNKDIKIDTTKLIIYNEYPKEECVFDEPKKLSKTATAEIEIKKLSTKKFMTNYEKVVLLKYAIDPKLFETRSLWIKLGLCLFNIYEGKELGLVQFDRLSSQTSYYKNNKCKAKQEVISEWQSFQLQQNGVGFGTVYEIAKDSNYMNIFNIYNFVDKISRLIVLEKGKTNTESIAKFCSEYLKDVLVCTNNSGKTIIYYFCSNNNIWTELLDINIFNIIPDYIRGIFDKYKKSINNIKLLFTEELYDVVINKIDHIKSLFLAKKDYKDIIDRFSCLLHDHTGLFYDSLNQNKYFFSFNDGWLLDLENIEYRPIQPNDRQVNYCNFSHTEVMNCHNVTKIEELLRNMFQDQAQYDFMLSHMSNILYSNFMQRLTCMVGTGANGKSLLINLLSDCLGKYCLTIPVVLLSSKYNDQNTGSNLAYSKFSKIIVTTEPKANEELSNEKLKALTGGDRVCFRKMYEIEARGFVPSAHLFIASNSGLNIKADDNAIDRRLILCNFETQFVEDSTKLLYSHQKLIDFTIQKNINELSKQFLKLLINVWITKHNSSDNPDINKRHLVIIPQNIIDEQADFLDGNDTIKEFIETNYDFIINEPNVQNFPNKKSNEYKIEYDKLNRPTKFLDIYNEYKKWARSKRIDVIEGENVFKSKMKVLFPAVQVYRNRAIIYSNGIDGKINKKKLSFKSITFLYPKNDELLN